MLHIKILACVINMTLVTCPQGHKESDMTEVTEHKHTCAEGHTQFYLVKNSVVFQHRKLNYTTHANSVISEKVLLFWGLFIFIELYLIYNVKLVADVQHSYSVIHKCLFFLRSFSLIGYHKILSLVPCAIQQVLVVTYLVSIFYIYMLPILCIVVNIC